MKEGDLTEKPHDNIYVIPITLEDKWWLVKWYNNI